MDEERNSIQIVKRGKESHFELDEQGLKKTLQHAWGQPVAIITICGSKRSGKSFLLNMFLHLKVKGMPKKGWPILSAFTKPELLRTVFGCNYGEKNDNEGIWILDKPFIVDSSSGKVALYLMDVQQGTSDQTSKESTQIITLATLMTSHLILNFTGHIQATYSEHFNFLKEVGSYLHQEELKPMLRELFFFIRDHPDLDTNVTKSPLTVTEESGFENLAIRTRISKFPSPNESVTEREVGEARPVDMLGINDIFLQHVSAVCDDLLDGKYSSRPVQLNDVALNGGQLYDYTLACCKHLLTESYPNAAKLGETMASFQLQRVLEKCEMIYKDNSAENMQNFEKGNLCWLRLETETLQMFDATPKWGSEDLSKEYTDKLKSIIEQRNESMATSQLKNLVKEKATWYETTFGKKLTTSNKGHFYCRQLHKDLEQEILEAFDEVPKLGSYDLVRESRRELIDYIKHIYKSMSSAYAQRDFLQDVVNKQVDLTAENAYLKQRLYVVQKENEQKIKQLTSEAKQKEQALQKLWTETSKNKQIIQQLTKQVAEKDHKIEELENKQRLQEKKVLEMKKMMEDMINPSAKQTNK